MTRGKVALGAIIGAVAGVIAGVLTAPKAGKETRADIRAKAAELKDDAARRASSAKHRGGEIVEEVKAKADDFFDTNKKGENDKK